MAEYSQEHRRIAVETPLGKDVLLLRSFAGQEEMSRLFSYELDLLSTKPDLAAKDIVGKNVSFSVEFADDTPRYFNGHVSRFANCGHGDRLTLYKAQVVPWLWFLTRTSDCRIFQNKSVPDIIKQIFGDLGFSDYQVELKGTHDKWEYCVQYRETDFNFVSRLMEHEGIFYYFQHQQGKHMLVLADSKGSYKDCKENQVDFAAKLSEGNPFDLLTSWQHQHEFRSGKWAQTDYNFETPSTKLMAQTNSLNKIGDNSKFEFYDHPGEYEKKSEGDGEVKLRMEEEETPFDTVLGEGMARSFSPGAKFKIRKHHTKAEEGKGYVVTGVRHSGSLGGTYVSNSAGSGDFYQNSFTCIPDSVTYRPARITPKPMIHGAQTAVVVGPKGEEIYPDKYGRVKVQFYWDREGKLDEKSSCFVRCAQTSAGKGWGSMFIPRIGQEVVVTYLEGDPDRPLITGVVYNAEQMPAYPLPDEKTKSYIKTNSSKDGDGFNELRFEDKKGKEQIFVHAERNMDQRVKHDSMEAVVGNRHLLVGDDSKKTGDQYEQIIKDKHLHVGGNHSEKIEGDMQLLVQGTGGNLDLYVDKDRKETIGGDSHHHVKGGRKETVAGDQSLTVLGNQQEKISMKHAVDAGTEIHIKAGMKVVIEAGVQLSLVASGSFIDIGPAGVSIQGTMVLINSGGAAGVGSGSSPDAPTEAKKAAPKDPDKADDSKTGHKSCSG